MSEFPNELRCDHLILLVDDDPLLNAISAKLLLKPGGRITLIYSEHSMQPAERLEHWLHQNLTSAVIEPVQAQLCILEHTPASIYYRLDNALTQGTGNIICLNYSNDGMRSIACHAYRAVEQWVKIHKYDVKPIFSYLDARKHCLFFDPPYEEQIYIGDKLTLSLEDMLYLRGIALVEAGSSPHLFLPKTARAIAADYSQRHRARVSVYQRWKEKELYPKCYMDKAGLWRRKSDLRKIRLAWPEDKAIAAALQEETGQHGQAELDIEAAQHAAGFSDPRDFCRWLDTFWLESCVIQALQSLPDSLRPHQIIQGAKVDLHRNDVSLDLVAIRGYQLFSFSFNSAVGTDAQAQNALKLNLFEHFMRTRQIGGWLACAALVCVNEDSDRLQDAAYKQIDPYGSARVFGLPHLEELRAAIGYWFENQPRARPSKMLSVAY
ncbi:MAG: hypothetical protein J7601_09270 [Chloroflexi bacterium]|nr:hypothetical protein [Chloroflexota bacterium]